MLYESILLIAIVAMTSAVLTGCSSKKKTAPSVAKSPANNGKSPVSVTKSPVSKSPAKDKDGDEKRDGDGEKKENKEDEKKDNNNDEKKEDKKDEKEDKKKSDEKDDEKKEDDPEKKKESDEKEEDKKDEDKETKPKKKEIFICPDPSELCFEAAITSQKKLRLKNLSSKKLMFKIKATTTNTYLINPVFGKIEPNNFADVMITHRPSTKREDKLVIMTSEMLGKEIEMAKTFKQIKTTGADVSVKLIAS